MAKISVWPKCKCGCNELTDRYPKPPHRWKGYNAYKKGHSPASRKTLSDGRRICKKCEIAKEVSEFHSFMGNKKGIASYCKPCMTIYSREHKIKHYGTYKNASLVIRYGISEEDFENIKSRQNGRCAICHRSNTRLCVDHCHSSKKVRGLLCCRCNTILGIWKDSPDAAMRAYRYLS